MDNYYRLLSMLSPEDRQVSVAPSLNMRSRERAPGNVINLCHLQGAIHAILQPMLFLLLHQDARDIYISVGSKSFKVSQLLYGYATSKLQI